MRHVGSNRKPPENGDTRTKERRKNLRLRGLVDEFNAGIERNRVELRMQLKRMGQMQAELDELKRGHPKG
jgi:hypothetical protein